MLREGCCGRTEPMGPLTTRAIIAMPLQIHTSTGRIATRPPRWKNRTIPRNLEATTPERTSLAVVAVLAQHLRRHVVRRATGGMKEFSTSAAIAVRVSDVQRAETEVADLQVALGVQEQVLYV
jgi:hypothetical protein